ncbi:hypothetical protein ACX3YG_16555 [Pseudomonas wadenswilerensis]
MTIEKTGLVDETGEVRELTTLDLEHARRASEAFPVALQVKLGMRKIGSAESKEAAHAEHNACAPSGKTLDDEA